MRKKTTNIAILSETGKYPIAIKVYKAIVKYWLRLHTTKNILLTEARDLNQKHDQRGGQNWIRMVRYLTKAIGINIRPSSNPKSNNKLILDIKTKIHQHFDQWWQSRRQEGGKLDFYFKQKKIFKREEYLDTLPRNLRTHITRMRTSSHIFPVEVLRYNKNKPHRNERVCDVCQLKETGDELHYLLRCGNEQISQIRQNFFTDIKKELPQFTYFSLENIILYSLPMIDQLIHKPMASYVKKILEAYKSEKGDRPKVKPTTITTRSGRTVKKPKKLDL